MPVKLTEDQQKQLIDYQKTIIKTGIPVDSSEYEIKVDTFIESLTAQGTTTSDGDGIDSEQPNLFWLSQDILIPRLQ